MKITPLQIKNQDFKKVLRGFDPVEVNTFLEMIANEMEQLLREQRENREKNIELETQLKDYRQLEKSLQQTLLQVQESSARAQEQAEKEAELHVKNAESEAANILQKARDDLSRLRLEIDRLKTTRETMVNRLKLLLNSQLELLRSIDADEEMNERENYEVRFGTKSKSVDEIVEKIESEDQVESEK